MACLPLALMSIAITGFQFGVANNIYHIPYVLDFASLPDFAGQAFVQSLDKFTSALWPIVRLAANESNVQDLFFVMAVLSRLLALAAIAYLLRIELGVNAVGLQVACLTVVAATPLMTGYSPVGSHGLFLAYFTHTEATWGPVFMSMALMGRSRPAASAGLTGIAFLLNAFVGIWMVFVNCASRIFHLRRLPKGAEALAYLCVLALVTAPVLWWISSAVLGPRQDVAFSYIEYVREFYPNHFLIEAAEFDRLAALAVLIVCGCMAALFMSDPRYWVGVQLAVVVLLGVGAILPYLINQRFVFNLHLLRADGLAQAVATVLCAIAGVKLWCDGDSARQRWMGVIVLVCLLCWPKSLAATALPTLALALLAGLSGRADRIPVRRLAGWVRRHERNLAWFATGGLVGVGVFELATIGPNLQLALRFAFVAVAFWQIRHRAGAVAAGARGALIGCMALAVCVAGLTSYRRMSSEAEVFGSVKSQDWGQMLAWVRTSDIHGVFLTSLEMSDEFELRARRPVWVGARQGAAVMWEPSFYGLWLPRLNEVALLKNASELIAYAQLHDIRHVMIETEAGECVAPGELVKRFGRFALCRIEPASSRN